MINFSYLANLFEKLENSSGRLEKVMILRDFLEDNSEFNKINIFDLISGNLQREINKKSLNISLKTIFSVLSFISKASLEDIEKNFNKSGDIGLVAEDLFKRVKQSSLINSKLTLDLIINSLDEISKISGNNSNKRKKEIISKLFLNADSNIEYKFLARLLINDLRIGVSVGVLKESSVNYFFPKIIGIHKYCRNCNYFSINLNKCYKCGKIIENEGTNYSEFKIVEVSTPENIIGLNNFIGDLSSLEKIRFMLRINRKTHLISSKNSREIYNLFMTLFEKKYNLINNFKKIFIEIDQDLLKILDREIQLGDPVKSMLGTRVANIDEAFNVSDSPALIDYKYDGLRVQIHNDFGKVWLFSRNLEDITKQFPEVVEFIKKNFSDLSFVIDSECVGFDFKSRKFLDFQILSRRIMSKNFSEVSHINVIVKFFDILYFNGKTIIDNEYSYRRDLVESLMLNRDLEQSLNFDETILKTKFRNNFNYD